MAHDFEKFPELTNSQMAFYYFDSPHKQIFEDFFCYVTKVIDGDTLNLKWLERDFEFPIRLLGTDAPELNEPRGKEVQQWLEGRLLGEEVLVLIDPEQRVGKFGRLLGIIFHTGMDIGDEMLMLGKVTTFENRKEGQIPDPNREFNIKNAT